MNKAGTIKQQIVMLNLFQHLHLTNNHGFTLIELLVVVLIIGILAAIALPQYQKAVKKATLAKHMDMARVLRNAEELFF